MFELEFHSVPVQSHARPMDESVRFATGLVKLVTPRSARERTHFSLGLRVCGAALRLCGAGVRSWRGAALVALVAACSSIPRGATPANFSNAQSASPQGFALFKQNCAGCHGERGESVTKAPSIMGPGALPEYPPQRDANADPASGDPELLKLQAQTRPAGAPWRDPFRDADDLYHYVQKNMPLPADKAGSLSAEEYWAIVNFMLLGHGVQVPPGGVTAENAHSVKLK